MKTDKYRVWHTSNKGQKRYYVETIKDAILIINVLTIHEVEDESIKWNTFGLEEVNKKTDTWEEYYNEEGLNISEIMEKEDELSEVPSYDYLIRGE